MVDNQCQSHGTVQSQQKVIIQRLNTHEKAINDGLSRLRLQELTSINDAEHQRTLEKIDKLQEIQNEVKETVITSLSDIKIIVEKNNLKIAIMTASVVFAMSLVAQYLIHVL
jgi:hypothetical protein